MASYISEILVERGIADTKAWLASNADEFKIFCKNANNLEVTRVRSLIEELKELKVDEDFKWSLHDEEEAHLWYILVRVIEEFRSWHGYYAGLTDNNQDSSVENKAQYE